MLRSVVLVSILGLTALQASSQAIRERTAPSGKPRDQSTALNLEFALREASIQRSPTLLDVQRTTANVDAINRMLSQLIDQRQQQVAPTGNEGGTQSDALSQIAAKARPSAALADVEALAAKLKASESTACTRKVVQTLDDAQRTVRNLPVDSDDVPPDSRLYRFLHHLPGAERETVTSSPLLKQLEVAWRSVLSNCFAAPTDRALFPQLSGRIGVFSVPGAAPFCSGTLMQDGKILTARHCFIHPTSGEVLSQNLRGLTFALADGSAVLSITNALVTSNSIGYQMLSDWIVVDAPSQGKVLSKFAVADQLISYTDILKGSANPTPLEIFAVIPLAKTLDPARFPRSIAGYSLPGCYVVFRQARCVTHMCSVVPGGSGASLFTNGPAGAQWVGVHIGAETTEGGSCSGTTTATNVALRKNQDLNPFFAD